MATTPFEPHNLPLIKLIGDEQENFYQLGLKDKDAYLDVHQHIRSIFDPDIPVLGTILTSTLEEVLKRSWSPFGTLKPLIDSYAQGLDTDPVSLQFSLLLPELMSNMHAWLPSMNTFLLGCSSFFMRDESTSKLIHARILDFPLQGSYDVHERAISYQLKNQNKVFAYNCAGFPFASLTGMNEHGISLALHQKFTDLFNKNGTSIFEIAHNILTRACNKEDVFKILNESQSLTTWNLNIGFAHESQVLEVDLLGDNYIYSEYELDRGEFLYLNNQLIDATDEVYPYLPYGMDFYNQGRERAADQIFKQMSSKKHNAKNLIQLMGTHPFHQKADTLPVLTPSSVLVTTMEASQGRTLFIAGEAPKEISSGLLEIDQVWSAPQQKAVKTSTKYTDKQKDFLLAKKYLMQSQVDFDLKDYQACYHNAQMAIDLLQGSNEQKIAQFYFTLFQYLLESDKRVLAVLTSQMRQLVGHLPPILNDHAQLCIFRLEKIIGSKSAVTPDQFSHPKIKEIYLRENKIPPFMLHQVTKKTTLPRLDIYDVLYLYGKL